MKILQTKQFTVIKMADFVEKDGNKSLKCTIEIKEDMWSQKHQKMYKQKEIWFDAIIRGTQEELQALKDRMLEKTLKINANKELPKEERKPMNNKPCVKINAFEFDYITYYFPATKTFKTSIIIDKWDFTSKKLHLDYKPTLFTQEEVDKMIEIEKKKLKVEFEKEKKKKENYFDDTIQRRVLF